MIALCSLVPSLISSRAWGECVPKESCYCRIEPNSANDHILIRAVVSGISDVSASLTVLGEPWFDPDNQLADGQLVEGLDCTQIKMTYRSSNCSRFKTGMTGIFQIDYNESRIRSLVWESNGILECDFDPGFPGIPTDEMKVILLSGDCWTVVGDWDIDIGCDESGCCSSSTISGAHGNISSFFLLILALFVLQRHHNI